MIAGSTWTEDIDHLKDALPKDFFAANRLIIVPHDVNESNIQYVENAFSGQTIRYSKYVDSTSAPVLIVDCTGLLSSMYRYGSFAYIGGGFGVSVHNILEAAVYGLPNHFWSKSYKSKRSS